MSKVTPTPTAPASKNEPFMVRLPPELVDRLRTEAENNRRTISGELRIALEKHLDGQDPAGKKK